MENLILFWSEVGFPGTFHLIKVINMSLSWTPHGTPYYLFRENNSFWGRAAGVCVFMRACLCVCEPWLVRGMLWLTPGWAVTMDQLFHTAGKFQSDAERDRKEREGDAEAKRLQLPEKLFFFNRTVLKSFPLINYIFIFFVRMNPLVLWETSGLEINFSKSSIIWRFNLVRYVCVFLFEWIHASLHEGGKSERSKTEGRKWVCLVNSVSALAMLRPL